MVSTANKYTAQYKEEKRKDHNACFMCFRNMEHKAVVPPKFVKCLLFSREYHFNSHNTNELDDY